MNDGVIFVGGNKTFLGTDIYHTNLLLFRNCYGITIAVVSLSCMVAMATQATP